MDAKPHQVDSAPVPSAERFELKNFETFKSGKQYYIIRNRKPEHDASPGEAPARTVVVLGTGRSGTTMTAGVLRVLGEQLGNDLNGRLEDREVTACLLSAYQSFLCWRIIFLRHRFSKVMKDRNRRWRRWTFKSPYLTPFIPVLSGKIVNPYFIVTTRNLLETSFGLAAYVRGGWRTSMLSATLQHVFLVLFCLTTRRPVMLFSYEHVTERDSDVFIEVLADFLSIDADKAKKQAAIDYIDPKRGYAARGSAVVPALVGHVERLTATRIRGWVSDTGRPERSFVVEIRSDCGVIATIRADRTRRDVRDAGFHQTGACGFDVAFDPPLRDEDLKNVYLFVPETGERPISP